MPPIIAILSCFVTLLTTATLSDPIPSTEPNAPRTTSKAKDDRPINADASHVVTTTTTTTTTKDAILISGSTCWRNLYCGDEKDGADRKWTFDPFVPRITTDCRGSGSKVDWPAWCRYGDEYLGLSPNRSRLQLRNAMVANGRDFSPHAGVYTCLWNASKSESRTADADGAISGGNGASSGGASVIHRYRYNVSVCDEDSKWEYLPPSPQGCVDVGRPKDFRFRVKMKKLIRETNGREWMLRDGFKVEAHLCRDDSPASSSSSSSSTSSSSSSSSTSSFDDCELRNVSHPSLTSIDSCHDSFDVEFSIPEITEDMKKVRFNLVPFCSDSADAKECGKLACGNRRRSPKLSSSSSPSFSVSKEINLTSYSTGSGECHRVDPKLVAKAAVGAVGGCLFLLLLFGVGKMFAPFVRRFWREKIPSLAEMRGG